MFFFCRLKTKFSLYIRVLIYKHQFLLDINCVNVTINVGGYEMNLITQMINESGLSKVKVAKYLGVSRQMLYNYLALDNFEDLPKDKQTKLLHLFDVEKEEDLKNITLNESVLLALETKINEELLEISANPITDFRGLSKKEQETMTELIQLLKKVIQEEANANDKKYSTAHTTLKYLYYYIQTMRKVPELKYILAYMAKANGIIDPLEFAYDEDRQFVFEGILFSAMNLYTTGNASRNRVAESHKKFETEIMQKKEERMGRTQELEFVQKIALQELGYTSINANNSKEVLEKIAEIMMRTF